MLDRLYGYGLDPWLIFNKNAMLVQAAKDKAVEIAEELTRKSYILSVYYSLVYEQKEREREREANLQEWIAGLIAYTGKNVAQFISQTKDGDNEKGGLDRFKEDAKTAKQWYDIYKGKSYKDIVTENGYQYKYILLKGIPLGPKVRYVIDPFNPDVVIDMRHFLVIGSVEPSIGNLLEDLQGWFGREDSSNDPQDYYSNNLGYKFRDFIKYSPDRFAEYGYDIRKVPNIHNIDYGRLVYIFLTTPEFRK